MEVHPGDIVAGKYRVRGILGRSRGLLLDAAHTEFDQRVAIRLISPQLSDEKEVERFRREARTLAKLESEHVARIIDVGTHVDGSFFLVRQYLEGIDLGQHLKRSGPLRLDEAVLYLLQAAEAVQETHSHNIILRELSPQQLFLTARRGGSPLVKIIEFGTAKLLRDPGAAPVSAGEGTATTMFGMSPYSSPELVRHARVIDQRTDVWSLGAIFYEMLTATPPFRGDLAELMLSITRDEPRPLSQMRPDLPRELEQILAWALAKDAQGRFESVYAFAHALRPYAPPEGQVLVDRIGLLSQTRPVAAGEPAPPSYSPTSPLSKQAARGGVITEPAGDLTGTQDVALRPVTSADRSNPSGFGPADRSNPSGFGPADRSNPSGFAPADRSHPSGFGPMNAPPGRPAPQPHSQVPYAQAPAPVPPPPSLDENEGGAESPMERTKFLGELGFDAPPLPAPPGAIGSPGPAPAPPAPPRSAIPGAPNMMGSGVASGLPGGRLAALGEMRGDADYSQGGGGRPPAAATGAHTALERSVGNARQRKLAMGVIVVALVVLPIIVLVLVFALRSPSDSEQVGSASASSSSTAAAPATSPTPPPSAATTPSASSAPPPSASGSAKEGGGTIAIDVTGGTCALTVDGKNAGSGGSVIVKIAPGAHTVVCRPANGPSKSQDVVVKAGASAAAKFAL